MGKKNSSKPTRNQQYKANVERLQDSGLSKSEARRSAQDITFGNPNSKTSGPNK